MKTHLHNHAFVLLVAAVSPLALACDSDSDGGGHGDTDDHGENQSEQITRVELTFAPDGGGVPVVAAFNDPDGDGGMSGTSDPITLAADTTYTVTVTFANVLEDPPQDITAEIQAEAEEHQVFFYGFGTLLTHAYADMESNYGSNVVGDDLPVGLSNTTTTMAAGSGELSVRLQHLPPVNETPVKEAGLVNALPSLPGETDADVTFDVTVQ